MATPVIRCAWLSGLLTVIGGLVLVVGCQNASVDVSEYAQGPAPLRMKSPAREGEEEHCYKDSLTGGHVFDMYCSECHNARALGERPFSNYKNVAAHMRVRANLTGEEYAKLMEFLRSWHDVPPPNPPLEPTPTRFFFSQPINELRERKAVSAPKPADAKEKVEEVQGPSSP